MSPRHTPSDPLTQLIALQRADGSWAMDAPLLDLLRLDRDAVERLRKRLGRSGIGTESILATALALRELANHRDQETLWRRIARKARSWLAHQGCEPPEGGDWIAWLNAELAP
jgi:hypothetical protein